MRLEGLIKNYFGIVPHGITPTWLFRLILQHNHRHHLNLPLCVELVKGVRLELAGMAIFFHLAVKICRLLPINKM